MRSRALTILLLCLLGVPAATHGNRAQPPAVTIYDENPSHLWNRVHRALLVREGLNADELVGVDSVDPILWSNTRRLLVGESHRAAIEVLDEFLSGGGEKLIDEPAKRASLQRDLWAVFDWSCAAEDHKPQRQALQDRLARAIARVALTKAQIDALPDTCAAAAARLADDSVLPRDLRDPSGPWIDMYRPGDGIATPAHLKAFGGRSIFNALIRHPDGREAGLAYLHTISTFDQPYIAVADPSNSGRRGLRLNSELPQFPVGTRVALLRRAMLIDDRGDLVATRLAVSVQFRTYRRIPAAGEQPRRDDQDFDEFVVTRRALFADPATALRRRTADETDILHVQFASHGIDWIEAPPNRPGEVRRLAHPVMEGCFSCHNGPGIRAVNTFSRLFGPETFRPTVGGGSPDAQDGYAVAYKRERFDWGLLHGLIRRGNPGD
jgi:hypothetical protein